MISTMHANDSQWRGQRFAVICSDAGYMEKGGQEVVGASDTSTDGGRMGSIGLEVTR